MGFIWTIFLFAVIMTVLVVVHELGHYLAAKAVKAKVNKFGIGFGPALFSRFNKSGEEFRINLVPFGGYVEMAGEDGKETSLHKEDPSLIENKKAHEKLFVALLGPLFSIIFAYFVFCGIGITNGIPYVQIQEVSKNSPAYLAGLKAGDIIKSIDGNNIYDPSSIMLSASANKKVTFNVENNGIKNIDISPIKDKNNNYVFGIKMSVIYKNNISFRALADYTNYYMVMMLETLKQLFTGKLGVKNLSGPVGIAVVINKAAENGFYMIMKILAFLSLNLGIINLLPLPALDGGRIVFNLIEMITRRKLSENVEGMIHTIGFFILMGFTAIMCFIDISRIIKI